ncbi:hypothetical protein TUM12151_18060 [Morganella morganii]|nr:hypothetical protein TUM12149_14610 [Morganella morganii]GIZ30682.1 hypothetical protein TUM12150_11680 [Morganella morganii]GIZ34820.1 hypothetical protein TUM12151_18060 [Morganella morganii]
MRKAKKAIKKRATTMIMIKNRGQIQNYKKRIAKAVINQNTTALSICCNLYFIINFPDQVHPSW